MVTDTDLRVLHVGGSLLARPADGSRSWCGRHVSDVLPAATWKHLCQAFDRALSGEPQSLEARSPDGCGIWWWQITPIADVPDPVSSIVVIVKDVTDRLQVTEQLARTETRLREAEQLIGVGSWELDLQTQALTCSEGLQRLLGVAPGQALDLHAYREMVHPDDRAVLDAAAAHWLSAGTPATFEYRIRRGDGAERLFLAVGAADVGEVGSPSYLHGAILDVTEERIAERERLEAVSLFRQGFDQSPIGMVLTDPRNGRYVQVNDAMCALLARPRDALLSMTVDDVTHRDDRRVDHEARNAMIEGRAGHVDIEKRYLRPDGTDRWAELHITPVRRADGSVRAFFTQVIDITERKERAAKLEAQAEDAVTLARIRDAIDDDRLVLYIQPIVSLRTGETVQHELLLRMRAQDGTIVGPASFLPAAERHGLIGEIDRWVVREAVAMAAAGTAVEFNLSGVSLGDPTMIDEIEAAIAASGADPSLLVVEVTETAMMEHVGAGNDFADRLRALGCHLALDDFGMGWGSLAYLKHLPSDHLKIDIEFVRDLVHSSRDERLVRAIVGLAREFHQTTTAEGVEDERTLVRLRELGVDQAQGYYLGRPQPIGDLAPLASALAVERGESRAIVRAGLKALGDHDVGALIPLTHSDVELRAARSVARHDGGQRYRGHEGLRAYISGAEASQLAIEPVPTAIREVEGAVIVFAEIRRSPAHGAAGPTDLVMLWRVRDGLVASIDIFEQIIA